MTNKVIKIKDLPSPKGHILLGNLKDFKKNNKHQVLEEWAKMYGNLYKIRLASMELVVSADPDINSKILRLRPEKFRRFSKMNEIFEEMGIIGVFNAENEVWKRHRKPVAEALNTQNVRGFYPIIKDKTQEFLNKLKTLTKKNESINIRKELILYTIDVTTNIAFGYELDSINKENTHFQKQLELIFPMINERITAPFPTWRYIEQKKDKQLKVALTTIESLIHKFIDNTKKQLEENPLSKENPSNFLEAILIENEKNVFSDKEIYGNIFSLLLAGEDTTSNSIAWALFYLAQYPDIVKKVREEANSVYPTMEVPENYSDLSLLKHANSVAQEAIRLKPTTPQLYMEANDNVIINDLEIPKKTKIILQNKVAQTDDTYFTNANVFKPERWLKNECPMHNKHYPNVVRTFGGGSRFCPGMHLALTEMTIAISVLCKQFDFNLTVKPEAVKEIFEFTMYPDNLVIEFKSVVG